MEMVQLISKQVKLHQLVQAKMLHKNKLGFARYNSYLLIEINS
jgi:hypothetical protein